MGYSATDNVSGHKYLSQYAILKSLVGTIGPDLWKYFKFLLELSIIAWMFFISYLAMGNAMCAQIDAHFMHSESIDLL